MIEPLRVLHVQSDTGLSGGIAGYISVLVRSPAMQANASLVVVAGRKEDLARTAVLYGDATTLTLAANYGRAGIVSYLRALLATVQRERVDVIHAHALRSAVPAAVVSWITQVPLVYTNHGLRYTQKPPGLSRAVFRALETMVCRQAQAVVAIRRHDAQLLQRAGIVPKGRLRIIETRINPPIGTRAVQKTGDSALLIGVGSLIAVKRVDRFLDWIEALQATGIAARAIWAGEGPLRAALATDAAARQLPVQFVGQLDHAGLAKLYGSASLLLISSDFEVFPLSVLEAAANGVPVVSGRFDGIEDIVVADGTGVLVDADNPVAAAEAIAAVLQLDGVLPSLAAAARRRFNDRFADPDKMAALYAEVYANVALCPTGTVAKRRDAHLEESSNNPMDKVP